MDVNITYINILIDTLNKKLNILKQIMDETGIQKDLLDNTPLDVEKYEESFAVKDVLINNILELDQGFENLYDRIKEEITSNKNKYREEILTLQGLIQELTDISIKLQLLESSNKIKMEVYFKNQKSEIKRKKIFNKTALGYYKNMTDQHQEGQSYFIDKKK